MRLGISLKKALLIVALAFLTPTSAWCKSQKTSRSDCLKALLQSLFTHDVSHPNVSLPRNIELALRKKDISQYFEISADLWKQGVDQSKLETLLRKIASGKKLSLEESNAYRDLRSRLKHLRFAFMAFSKDHRAPKSVEKLAIALGKAQDAYKNGRSELVQQEAEKAIQLLKDDSFGSIKDGIKKFEPARGKSFRKWVGAQMGIISEGLEKDRVAPKEFHEMRKAIGRMMSVYSVLEVTEPSRDTMRIARVLSTVNGKMGAIHDKLITEKLNGAIDYDHGSMKVPEDIRKQLKEIMQRFNDAVEE